MKTQKINFIKNWSSLILLITLFALTSCNNGGAENTEEASTPKAPKMDIMAATFMGNTEAVQGHIAAKTDLNQKDDFGSTPLTIASTFGKIEIAKLLIEGGADLNATSADGSTPLHTASFFGHTEIVKQLLAKNADLTIRNSFGVTALESLSVPFGQVKAVYDQVGKDLGPLGLKLDYAKIETARPVIAEMIRKAQQ
ncbi:MAG: ankyrin repeat domain-containing protein [Roseivirga sp.]|nr:ankyrin repeat domain-containing protein [Roseivirga sp.]